MADQAINSTPPGKDYLKNFAANLKETDREKATSNKTPALSKIMNMDIWVVTTSNQLVMRQSYAETKFSKK